MHKANHAILLYMYMEPKKAYTLHQLYRQCRVSEKTDQAALQAALCRLIKKKQIARLPKARYALVTKPRYLVGQVDHVSPTYAYIVSKDDAQEDIWVKQEDLSGALHKDLVKVVVLQQADEKRRAVGSVVAIVKRNNKPIIGRWEQRGAHAFVIPDGRRMHYDICIKDKKSKGAKDNDKVIVKVVDWPRGTLYPVGIVQSVIGQAGIHEVEMHAIMAEFGLSASFPDQVTAEAAHMPVGIPTSEVANRKDFRTVPTFTIDPEDAKDFDDALSLRKLSNGHYEVGIHIADASYYVQEGSCLDQEALARGTSVYLVDRTLPMLPESISNDLCSLNPYEDKLTFSVVAELDRQGKVHQIWLGETIIRSQKRFTYETAQYVLTQQSGDYYEELTILNQLAQKLRAERFRNGSINFETVEVKFQLDAQGKPLHIIPKVVQDTHKLVEAFMLLANVHVATHVSKMQPGKNAPTFVYRTHDTPNPDKLDDFWAFVAQLGYGKMRTQQPIAGALNNILAITKASPEANIVHALAIRSMSKAVYTTEDKPHFGLAFQHYTHFTSPIRRYPDIMVHRLLKQYLRGQFGVALKPYEAKCQHTSERESVAADAERASVRYKQVEWLQSQQGETLSGVISGVTDWGIYVELMDSRCEGMVRLADMTDDYYELDERGLKLVGRHAKKVYRLGDRVVVQIQSCDLTKRTVSLRLVPQPTE